MFIVQTSFRPLYRVELKRDELDLMATESKTTYEEIKKYVLE